MLVLLPADILLTDVALIGGADVLEAFEIFLSDFELSSLLVGGVGSGESSLAKEEPREKSGRKLCMLNSFALLMSSSSLEFCSFLLSSIIGSSYAAGESSSKPPSSSLSILRASSLP